MSDGDFQSDGEQGAAVALAPIRVVGGARLVCTRSAAGNETHIVDLSEHGGYRLKFPTTHAAHLEAVQINTGGGIVGGDKLAFSVSCEAGTDLVYATQAAERIYRSSGAVSTIDVSLSVGARARLDWLPQETLLYSGARLRRRFDIDVAANGRLLLVECITFGRIASGETLGPGLLHDTWRVRRDGKLIFADATRIDGDVGMLLQQPASAARGRAVGFLLYVGEDAVDRLDGVREAIGSPRTDWGASAWNGMLTARFLAEDPADLRRDVRRITETIARRPLPRVWST